MANQLSTQDIMRRLRQKATDARLKRIDSLTILTVSDLLELHEMAGISMDDWEHARELCEMVVNEALALDEPWTLEPNGA